MVVSKLEEDSGSRASMLIVRQLSESVALETCCMIDIFADFKFQGTRVDSVKLEVDVCGC